jgi:endoglucanase
MSIIVMVTNLCPNNGNEQWCPAVGGTNQYGYSYHFDIMAQSEVFGDNPVVEFEPVPCPGQAVSDWETCVCNGQTASDETPVGIAAASAASSSPNPPASTTGTVNTPSPVADPPVNSTPVAQSPTPDPAPVSKALSTLSTVKVSGTSVPDPVSSPKGHGRHQQNAWAVSN